MSDGSDLKMDDGVYIGENNCRTDNKKDQTTKIVNADSTHNATSHDEVKKKKNGGLKTPESVGCLLNDNIIVEKQSLRMLSVAEQSTKQHLNTNINDGAATAKDIIECRISISKDAKQKAKVVPPPKQCVINRLLAFIAILSSLLFFTAVAYILTLSGSSMLSHFKAFQNRTQRERLNVCNDDELAVKVTTRRISNFSEGRDVEIIKVKVNDDVIFQFSTLGASLIAFYIRNNKGIMTNALVDFGDEKSLLTQNVGSVFGPFSTADVGCTNNASLFSNKVWNWYIDGRKLVFFRKFLDEEDQKLDAHVLYELSLDEIVIRYEIFISSMSQSLIEVTNNIPFYFNWTHSKIFISSNYYEALHNNTYTSDVMPTMASFLQNDTIYVYLNEYAGVKYIGTLYSDASGLKLAFFTNQPWTSFLHCTAENDANTDILFVRPHSLTKHSKNREKFRTSANGTYINEMRIRFSLDYTEN